MSSEPLTKDQLLEQLKRFTFAGKSAQEANQLKIAFEDLLKKNKASVDASLLTEVAKTSLQHAEIILAHDSSVELYARNILDIFQQHKNDPNVANLVSIMATKSPTWSLVTIANNNPDMVLEMLTDPALRKIIGPAGIKSILSANQDNDEFRQGMRVALTNLSEMLDAQESQLNEDSVATNLDKEFVRLWQLGMQAAKNQSNPQQQAEDVEKYESFKSLYPEVFARVERPLRQNPNPQVSSRTETTGGPQQDQPPNKELMDTIIAAMNSGKPQPIYKQRRDQSSSMVFHGEEPFLSVNPTNIKATGKIDTPEKARAFLAAAHARYGQGAPVFTKDPGELTLLKAAAGTPPKFRITDTRETYEAVKKAFVAERSQSFTETSDVSSSLRVTPLRPEQAQVIAPPQNSFINPMPNPDQAVTPPMPLQQTPPQPLPIIDSGIVNDAITQLLDDVNRTKYVQALIQQDGNTLFELSMDEGAMKISLKQPQQFAPGDGRKLLSALQTATDKITDGPHRSMVATNGDSSNKLNSGSISFDKSHTETLKQKLQITPPDPELHRSFGHS